MLKTLLLQKFNSGEISLVSLKDIMRLLNANTAFDKKQIQKVLTELESSGNILQDGSKRYALPEKLGAIRGKVKGNERGFAFLLPEDKSQPDLFLPPPALNGAMHGDTVFVRKANLQSRSSDEAVVVKILERGFKSIVGTFILENRFGFVRPDDKNYFKDIYIAQGLALNAKTGDKVVARISAFPDGSKKSPEGQIVEVLGKQFSKDAEEKSIIKTYNLPEEFDKKVLAQADKAAQEPISFDGRRDLTNEFIITIDGEDAKDLDDAISIKKTNSGYILGVHIADVSHYVTANSALDKEALSRGTSVYFPSSVIPMLPKQISNGICSLNAHTEKLALSCIMVVDKNGNVTSKEILKTVIKSKHRLTYNKVTDLLQGDSEALEEYKDAAPHIFAMQELAKILIKKRELRGSIDLDMKEAQIIVDGTNIQITEQKRTISHRIIEEFMILANETVAEYVFYMDLPFIYRVHEKPNPEKLIDFIAFIKELGYKVKWKDDSVHSKDFQAVLKNFEDTPLFTLVNKVMLRSMSKAKYHPTNTGHFGLSSTCYCHFTSPIRRYPDLFIHRVIKAIIDGQGPLIENEYKELAMQAAKTSSEKERNADEAERAMDDLFKVRYMQDKVGQEFDAVISGVTSFGVFAELENTVEGLIKLDTLPNGKYEYDEKRFTLKSKKLSLKLGDKVKIAVAAANPISKKIEFVLLEKIEKNTLNVL